MSERIYGDFGNNFIKNIEDSLGEKQRSLLQNIFKPVTVKKDWFFIQEGEKSTQLALVQKGLFRSFYIDEKGNDITKYFYPEGATLFSYAAYLSQKESIYYVQALENSELMMAKISDFEEIVEGDYQLLLFFKKILDNMLVMKENHANSFILLNSVERYKQFLLEYPGLEKRVKQYHLATYLGLTPVSLSRIRKKLDLIK
jgi:CRP-like cAMP-binding protein